MDWTEENVARLRELWEQGLSTAEIGRQLNVTKNAVVGKAHRLGLKARPSPIRRNAADKATAAKTKEAKTVTTIDKTKTEKTDVRSQDNLDSAPEAKVQLASEVKEKKPSSKKKVISTEENLAQKIEAAVEEQIEKPQTVKAKKLKTDFSKPVELPQRRSNTECCWPIGDPGTKDFHFCKATAIPGKPYCVEHAQIAYVRLRDRRGSVA